MKLLFDQNIFFRIVKEVQEVFPNSKQVRELGLENSSDNHIWNFAKKEGFTILTFDADFSDIASIKGSPPKIIWLRSGNLSTNNIAKLLFKHKEIIEEFLENKDYINISCLEIE